MLCRYDNEDRFDRLEGQLRSAHALTPELMSHVMAGSCVRLASLGHTTLPVRINRLVESRAWVDAAFTLIELELPAWKLRRLVYEDGEWFCSLSRQTNLPADLDDTADAHHEILPLAILGAFLEAKRRATSMREAIPHSVPQVQSAQADPICCDNFA
jgi:hypothetical protein